MCAAFCFCQQFSNIERWHKFLRNSSKLLAGSVCKEKNSKISYIELKRRFPPISSVFTVLLKNLPAYYCLLKYANLLSVTDQHVAIWKAEALHAQNLLLLVNRL